MNAFRAYFQQGFPVYAPRNIRFVVSMTPDDDDTHTYTSQWFSVDNIPGTNLVHIAVMVIINGDGDGDGSGDSSGDNRGLDSLLRVCRRRWYW